jgi:deoxyribodipyrimidine photo-lyase
MLSPALAVGTLSAAQAYHAALRRRRAAADHAARAAVDCFLGELGWREFSYHLLFHFPRTPDDNLTRRFDAFPWVDMRQGRHWLADWQRGRTGYPIVDAGMRQLWQTGWMHNRVRMIVASFLTKDLRIDWRHGARWFWDTLVDADLANNTQGWQWSAGSGADAQPYFRIFNPVLQGQRFDPDGVYVRTWCPELADVPARWIHRPWQWSGAAGLDYPEPIVDHAEARDAALAAFEKIKRA